MADESGYLEFIAVVAPIALKAIGSAAASGDNAEAERLRVEASRQYNIPLPDLQSIISALRTSSSLQAVMADPRYTAAQDDALGGMQELSKTGMGPQDRASLDAATMDAANTYSGMVGRNDQQRLARGQGGSGVDSANAMMAASQGADRAYKGAVQTAASSADRRLSALSSYGSMAERMRNADLMQKNRVAEGQDALDKFNTTTKLGAANQQFDNQTVLAAGKTGGLRDLASLKTAQGNKTENTYAGIGDGISTGAQSAAEEQRWNNYLEKRYPR